MVPLLIVYPWIKSIDRLTYYNFHIIIIIKTIAYYIYELFTNVLANMQDKFKCLKCTLQVPKYAFWIFKLNSKI